MNLDDVQSLLFFNGQWHARLRGAKDFHAGATPEEALQRARGQGGADADLF